ncbi:MAG: hypothetical protein IJ512_07295 [Ruminococcus sp.]|nr:hypothetical protein [Ruminococcus sp.]
MKKKNHAVQNAGSTVTAAETGFRLPVILRNLKKYFLPWLILAVLAAGIVVGKNIIFSTEVQALEVTICFNYKGIEAGLDPNGCEFETSSIKNDQCVKDALVTLGHSEDLMETVQNSIFIDGIVANTAIDKITAYKSLYSSASTAASGAWVEAMHDDTYHPTQYRVSFNYGVTGLEGDEAADLLNQILANYQNYFFETYGYSESIGESVLSVSFDDYDYLIALDMYSSTLSSLERYVDTLAANDPSQFRSAATGYSFSDLSDAIQLIRSVDIDTLTSYILNNGIISDKEVMVSYYNYRVDNLTRTKKNLTERLESVQSSIDTYQKDAILIYDGAESDSTSVTEATQTYDDLINQKLQLQESTSYYDRQLTTYKERLKSITQTKNKASESEIAYTQERVAALQEKVAALVEDVKLTADDYFENEKFTNAFSIAAPANSSLVQFIKSVINESMREIIIIELIFLTIYLAISILFCFPICKKLRKNKKTAAQ